MLLNQGLLYWFRPVSFCLQDVLFRKPCLHDATVTYKAHVLGNQIGWNGFSWDLGRYEPAMPDVDQLPRTELAEEQLNITKREVERGRIVVRTRVEDRDEVVEIALRQGEVTVERVPLGVPVEALPVAHEEDGVLIIPVVEEQLVVTTRLTHEAISIHGTDGGTAASSETATEGQGFWASLANLFMRDEDRHTYAEGLKRGSYMLSALVNGGGILERSAE